jgi:hypothetical protein
MGRRTKPPISRPNNVHPAVAAEASNRSRKDVAIGAVDSFDFLEVS